METGISSGRMGHSALVQYRLNLHKQTNKQPPEKKEKKGLNIEVRIYKVAMHYIKPRALNVN